MDALLPMGAPVAVGAPTVDAPVPLSGPAIRSRARGVVGGVRHAGSHRNGRHEERGVRKDP